MELISAETWDVITNQVAGLQEVCYEPARRDNLAEIGALLRDPDSLCIVAYDQASNQLIGTAIAAPLEAGSHLPGPSMDPMLGQGNTLYSLDVTVHPDHRGKGLGLVLKEGQVRWAMERRRRDGRERFYYMTGRNKVGATATMQALNRRFGAFTVGQLSGCGGVCAGSSWGYSIFD